MRPLSSWHISLHYVHPKFHISSHKTLDFQISRFPNFQIPRFPASRFQISSLKALAWQFRNLEPWGWKSGKLEIFKSGTLRLEIWKSRALGLEFWKFGDFLEVCERRRLNTAPVDLGAGGGVRAIWSSPPLKIHSPSFLL